MRRQRRHVRHVVLRLQLAADRVRAAAGAQGGLRDLRQRRPLDRRRALARRRAAAGRPRRLLPLHDADVRAAAGAGGVGRRLARGVAAPAGDQRAVGADLAAGEPRRRLLAARLGAPDGDGSGYDRIDVPGDARRRLGRRLPQQLVPHRRGAAARPACRTGCSPARGRTPTRRPRYPARGSTSTPRWSPGGTAGCAAERSTTHRDRRRRVRAHLDAPEPDLEEHEGYWVARRLAVAAQPSTDARALPGPRPLAVEPGRRRPPPGSTAPATCRGGCPATSASDDARSLTWEWDAAGEVAGRAPARAAAGQRRRAGGVAVGEAVRRLPRRHLGAGHAAAPSTWPTATACTRRPTEPLVPGRGVRRRGRARRLRLRASPPGSGCGSRSPAPTGRTPSLRRPR